ncbi:MAG: nucleoside-diphosphate kinase [Parcubacteria group bacterium Athens1014_10]|nr:MAG: nucleoside-diphosphate kinase [Parcubacteria group bacterium Athens1014_10]TSD05117.1 MAG: nucleoside-diphosphate kinase [Parcubacteria group bacterium Athens0714_12]
MIEQTLVLIKPDGLLKSLTGNIITTLSETKLDIVGVKMVQVTKELAKEHYSSYKEKSFFPELVSYITGELHGKKKVLAMVYHGEDAIKKIKELVGDTNPEKAHFLSIRGKYGRVLTSGVFENAIHASAAPEEAEKEIKLWFNPSELIVNIYPTEAKELKKEELVWK